MRRANPSAINIRECGTLYDVMAEDGVRLLRPRPVDAEGLLESADGDGGVKREEGVESDCGASEGEIGEGRIVEAVQR